MSDLMFYGVLRMPYIMAMSDEISRLQFYSRVQECADRCETAEALVAAQARTIEEKEALLNQALKDVSDLYDRQRQDGNDIAQLKAAQAIELSVTVGTPEFRRLLLDYRHEEFDQGAKRTDVIEYVDAWQRSVTAKAVAEVRADMTELANQAINDALRIGMEGTQAQAPVAAIPISADLNALAKRLMDETTTEAIEEGDNDFRAGKSCGILAMKIAVKEAIAVQSQQQGTEPALSDNDIRRLAQKGGFLDGDEAEWSFTDAGLLKFARDIATKTAAPQQHAQAALSDEQIIQLFKEQQTSWPPADCEIVNFARAILATRQPAPVASTPAMAVPVENMRLLAHATVAGTYLMKAKLILREQWNGALDDALNHIDIVRKALEANPQPSAAPVVADVALVKYPCQLSDEELADPEYVRAYIESHNESFADLLAAYNKLRAAQPPADTAPVNAKPMDELHEFQMYKSRKGHAAPYAGDGQFEYSTDQEQYEAWLGRAALVKRAASQPIGFIVQHDQNGGNFFAKVEGYGGMRAVYKDRCRLVYAASQPDSDRDAARLTARQPC